MKRFILIITALVIGMASASAQKSFFDYQSVGESIDSVYAAWKRDPDRGAYSVGPAERADQVLITSMYGGQIMSQTYLLFNIFTHTIYRKIIAVEDNITDFNYAIKEYNRRISTNSFIFPYYEKNANVEQFVRNEDNSRTFKCVMQMRAEPKDSYILEVVIEKKFSQYFGYVYKVYESYVDYTLQQ